MHYVERAESSVRKLYARWLRTEAGRNFRFARQAVFHQLWPPLSLSSRDKAILADLAALLRVAGTADDAYNGA